MIMKLLFVLFVIPFAAAVVERSAALDENHVVVLADLGRRTDTQPPYCYVADNYDCYL